MIIVISVIAIPVMLSPFSLGWHESPPVKNTLHLVTKQRTQIIVALFSLPTKCCLALWFFRCIHASLYEALSVGHSVGRSVDPLRVFFFYCGIWREMTVNNPQTIGNTPANNLQQTTGNHICSFSFCYSILVPSLLLLSVSVNQKSEMDDRTVILVDKRRELPI